MPPLFFALAATTLVSLHAPFAGDAHGSRPAWTRTLPSRACLDDSGGKLARVVFGKMAKSAEQARMIMLFKSRQGKQADFDYNGRVTQPSQKNFQLNDEFDVFGQ